ncbi:UDP-2,3-diacylglucosamine diphosphatase [Roseitalea porphyridii]|uniref:UDP-2,3-diacylglucosamine diphosphatase n=1 Tax=Roseitalea porphyridii TaxID=1852022 RepID=A0A4P6V062_9HYPH|nr:UDP-2,3-diacylglucosamine diphosphatase [Roseitalea porphyridii]QBK29916.1 UDP-2,3-diacylglucosamine diphosphatase [Roseitalea porphyridii]
MNEPQRFRTLFLSDIHLGTRGCQAEMLIDFLREHDADRIYLVGDIFDGWRLKKGWYWPQTHNDVVQKLLRKARKGTEIIYIPGNHDEVMRSYLGSHFGGIDVRDRDIHETADGTRYLVIHGDQFDMVVRNAKWLAHIGDWAYTAALWFNGWFNRVKRLWGGQYWSLSRWLKLKVKQAVNFIGAFEEALAAEARRSRVDGVICGHIHHAAIKSQAGIRYVNTGDWVESCTAIAETETGEMVLIDWVEIARARRRAKLIDLRAAKAGKPAKVKPRAA